MSETVVNPRLFLHLRESIILSSAASAWPHFWRLDMFLKELHFSFTSLMMRPLRVLRDCFLHDGFIYWRMQLVILWKVQWEVASRLHKLKFSMVIISLTVNIRSVPTTIRTLFSYRSWMTHASSPSTRNPRERSVFAIACGTSCPLDICLTKRGCLVILLVDILISDDSI